MRWLAALLPWPALIGLLPGNALAPIPTGFGCTQASAGAPVVCSGKVPSWDGVPLDADLTLPPGPVSPRPLIVMLHGYANQKTEWESTSAANANPDKDHCRTRDAHVGGCISPTGVSRFATPSTSLACWRIWGWPTHRRSQ